MIAGEESLSSPPRELRSWDAGRGVFGLALVPMAAVFVFFGLFAKDSPTAAAANSGQLCNHRARARLVVVLPVLRGDVRRLCRPGQLSQHLHFHDQYGLTKSAAGGFATLCVVAGSFLRPLGGYLADRAVDEHDPDHDHGV